MDTSTLMVVQTPGRPVTAPKIPPLPDKLPPELISYLIALSLPETASSRAYMKALYSIRMVSRTWKETIDSTPSLWSVVSGDVPLHVNSTAVQRSGCCPLHVFITSSGYRSYQRQQPGVTELLELATREIGRWSTARLWFPAPAFVPLHLTSPAPAPLLRNLRIASRNHGSPAPVSLFGGIAPKLQYLKVTQLRIDWTSSFIHGLRELDLVDMVQEQVSAQQVLDILASAPLLEHLGVYNSTLNHHLPSPHVSPATIRLPGLKTIIFRDINTEATAAILSPIHAPGCTGLTILDWTVHPMSFNFPEPALSHFSEFQRLTLSANNRSTVNFFDGHMTWECRSPSLSAMVFELEIPYDAPAVGIGWVARVVGSGAQEVVHNMEVGFDHGISSDGDQAAYSSLGRCQSITELYCHALNGPFIELLGTWRDAENGMGPSPSFPGLRTLVTPIQEGGMLDDLEVLVSRRFGESGENTGQDIPNLNIILYPWSPQGFQPDLTQLQRLRAAKGVESLARKLSKSIIGMRAVVYEDDAEFVATTLE